jgi:hypothetical protein
MSTRGVTFSIVLLAASNAACTHYPVDRSAGYGGSPATVALRDVPVRGFNVSVERRESGNVSGELLAVNPEFVYVEVDEETQAVPVADIRGVSVDLYANEWGWYALWTTLGTLSTVTHGRYLIFTAPAWLATGIPATASLAGAGKVRVEATQVQPQLFQFARFPAGLPAGWPSKRAPDD